MSSCPLSGSSLLEKQLSKTRGIHLVLYQSEIPQNVGTLMRLGACLGVSLHLIEPLGFCFSDARLRRAGMDYRDLCACTRYEDWEAFCEKRLISPQGVSDHKTADRRLIALIPDALVSYTDFAFRPGDYLLVGRESTGLPIDVTQRATAGVKIPMKSGMRSLNMAIAASLVLGEALRQTNEFPCEIAS